MIDRQKIATAIFDRLNIKVDQDDPAFMLLEMNALALEELLSPLFERLEGLEQLAEQLDEKGKEIENLIEKLALSKQILIAEIAANAKKEVEKELQKRMENQSVLKASFSIQYIVLLASVIIVVALSQFIHWFIRN